MSRFHFRLGHHMQQRAILAGLEMLFGKPMGVPKNKIPARNSVEFAFSIKPNSRIYVSAFRAGHTIVRVPPQEKAVRHLLETWRRGGQVR